jgi:hypothetical protein
MLGAQPQRGPGPILRTAFAFLISCAFAVLGQPVKNGPALGDWKYTGTDKAGVVWTGTLRLSEVDLNRVPSGRFYCMAQLKEKAGDRERGVDSGATWDASTRVLSFGNENPYTGGVTYSATLSADGKALTRGKLRETDRDKKVLNSGEWSATIPE